MPPLVIRCLAVIAGLSKLSSCGTCDKIHSAHTQGIKHNVEILLKRVSLTLNSEGPGVESTSGYIVVCKNCRLNVCFRGSWKWGGGSQINIFSSPVHRTICWKLSRVHVNWNLKHCLSIKSQIITKWTAITKTTTGYISILNPIVFKLQQFGLELENPLHEVLYGLQLWPSHTQRIEYSFEAWGFCPYRARGWHPDCSKIGSVGLGS